MVFGTGSSWPQDFRFLAVFFSSLEDGGGDDDDEDGEGAEMESEESEEVRVGERRRVVSARQRVAGWQKPSWAAAVSSVLFIIVGIVLVVSRWRERLCVFGCEFEERKGPSLAQSFGRTSGVL